MPFHGVVRAIPAIGWLLLLVGGGLRADTVRFRNGRALDDVIVVEESDASVVVDFGTDSSTLPRGTVAAVERAAPEANARLRDAWQEKHLLNRRYVPPEFAGLAAAFGQLGALRSDALRTNAALRAVAARETELHAEEDAVRTLADDVGRRLLETPPGRNVAAYNALVASNNALGVRARMARDEQAQCERTRAAVADRVAVYREALTGFGARLAQARQDVAAAPGSNAAARVAFLDRLAGRVAACERDFVLISVPVAPSRAGLVVTAVVNERTPGRFVVDTGATRVTVSEAFAARLGLDPASLPAVDFVMADGRKTRGRLAVLHAVAVGDARAEEVEAAVLPGVSSDGIDGLLGMSFLRLFAVNLDGATGRLNLRRFAPQP
jgi:clan AA aspartic protease (TIGR02281 family)